MLGIERLKHYYTLYNRNLVVGASIVAFSLVGITVLGSVKVKRENGRRESFHHLLKEYEQMPTLDTLVSLVQKAQSSSFLQKQYGKMLLQEQLFAGSEKLAFNFMKNLAIQKQSIINGYTRYSATSIEIAKQSYQKALQESLELDLELSAFESQALYSINSLRIAFLYQKLGRVSEEKAQLKKILADAQILNRLEMAIFDGNLTIKDYIEYRLNALAKSA